MNVVKVLFKPSVILYISNRFFFRRALFFHSVCFLSGFVCSQRKFIFRSCSCSFLHKSKNKRTKVMSRFGWEESVSNWRVGSLTFSRGKKKNKARRVISGVSLCVNLCFPSATIVVEAGGLERSRARGFWFPMLINSRVQNFRIDKKKFFVKLKTQECSKTKSNEICLKFFNQKSFRPDVVETILKKYYWRVWSWLRTNAGGMLNTCKSYEVYSSVDSRVDRMNCSGGRVRNA